MGINLIVVGSLDTNCYILELDGKVLIVDPGDEASTIKNNIKGEVIGILITHNHFDHIGARDELCLYYDVKYYDKNNLKEGKCTLDNFSFDVFYNPGHTLDSISFIFDDVMFSGDFIFKGAIGRYDLGGNYDLMLNSIKKILDLKKNFIIYPGHGNITNINEEKNFLYSLIDKY